MLKVEIKMNTERIIAAGEYELERIMRGIDNAFMQFGFRKDILEDGTICFWGNNHKDDYAHFGALIPAMSEEEWFMPYVDKWLWYNSDGQLDENCYRVEDILYYYTQKVSA